MSEAVKLPVRMDTAGASGVEETLAGDLPIQLDASDVQMVGGLCLEVLIRAVERRRGAGSGVTIEAPSDGFRQSLAVFGLDPEKLQSGGFSE